MASTARPSAARIPATSASNCPSTASGPPATSVPRQARFSTSPSVQAPRAPACRRDRCRSSGRRLGVSSSSPMNPGHARLEVGGTERQRPHDDGFGPRLPQQWHLYVRERRHPPPAVPAAPVPPRRSSPWPRSAAAASRPTPFIPISVPSKVSMASRSKAAPHRRDRRPDLQHDAGKAAQRGHQRSAPSMSSFSA